MPTSAFNLPGRSPSLWLSTGPQIPVESSVPLDTLATHLHALCADGTLVVVARSVLVREGAHICRVATVILPIPADDARAASETVTAGALMLVSAPLKSEQLRDGSMLATALVSAFPAGDALHRALGQSITPYVSRTSARDSANGRMAVTPLWRARFDGIRQNRIRLPRGPFFNARSGHFHASIQQATMAWTGLPLLGENDSTADDVYHVLLPDPRAYLKDVWVVDDGVEARVDGTLLGTHAQLYCAITGTDVDGDFVREVSPIVNGIVRFRFERLLRGCAIYVLDADGMAYDEHLERDLRATPGDSLFRGDGGARAARARILTLALESGEGEHVEFKEWIPKDRANSKSAELLESACALANADGGTIFIGVSDQGDLLGVERSLRKEYAKESGGDLTRLRDAYFRHARTVADRRAAAP